MTQMRKALFLPFNLAIAFAAPAVHAAGIDRRGVPGKGVVLSHPGRSSWESAP
jgi:hypothetical protein